MEVFDRISSTRPLVHTITNYITANDVVNSILAVGGTAIGADAPEEAAEITALADALLLNCGTPSRDRLSAMLAAGKAANAKGIPVVLDPVGAGASAFRSQILRKLLEEVRFSCIRGNRSEIAALAGMTFSSRGVEDAGMRASDETMMRLAERLDCVLAVTGATDMVVTRSEIRDLGGGTDILKYITGSGCMLSGLVACAIGAEFKARKMAMEAGKAEDSPAAEGNLASVESSAAEERLAADAAAAMLTAYGEAARQAEQEMLTGSAWGTMAFRQRLIDQISRAGVLRKEYEMMRILGNTEFTADCLRLYAITDRSWLKDGETLAQVVEQAILGGAGMVQLREKTLSREETLAEGEEILKVCRKYGVPFIVNDSVDLAAELDADGVHVGQDDADVREARARLGSKKIVGATAHNVEEAMIAEAAGADYLGVGAVFGSSTKKDAKPLAIEELTAVAESVRIPIVAIGGIQKDNMAQLKGSKIAGAAVVSAIFAAEDPRAAAEQLKALAESL